MQRFSIVLWIFLLLDSAYTYFAPARGCDNRNPFSPDDRGTYLHELNPLLANAFILTKFPSFESEFYQSKAFSHYFLPEDAEQVKRMLRSIASALSDSIEPLHVFCGVTTLAECNRRHEYRHLIPSRLSSGGLSFCDSFFEDSSRRSSRKKLNVNLFSRPFDSEGWCRPELSI